jgi:hypothetical protein
MTPLQAVVGACGQPITARLAAGRNGLIAVAFSLPSALPVPLTDVDYFGRAIRAAAARALEHDYALVVAPPTPQTTVWSSAQRRKPTSG